jgi:hypothetical protein
MVTKVLCLWYLDGVYNACSNDFTRYPLRFCKVRNNYSGAQAIKSYCFDILGVIYLSVL